MVENIYIIIKIKKLKKQFTYNLKKIYKYIYIY